MIARIGYWIINFLYWTLGTRTTIEEIYNDLITQGEVISEFLSMVKTFEITEFKNKKIKKLSRRRLIAISMKAFDIINGEKFNWPKTIEDSPIDIFKELILSKLDILLELYDFEYTTNTEVVNGVVYCKDLEINKLFLLSQFLITYMKEKENKVDLK